MQKYLILLELPYNGKKYKVGFKKTGFLAPYAAKGPVDVEQLAEKDKALIGRWTKSNADKRADLEEEFLLAPVVGPFITTLPEGKVVETKGTAFFDIMTDADYAEAALPAKAELNAEISAKDGELSAAEEKIEALKAELAEGKLKKE